MITVIYHANCYDGVTAAYVCKLMYPRAEFFPLNYSDSPPDVKGKDVFIVDFSFKRPILEQMRKDANSLVILDHHKTAEEALKDFPNAIFDMDRSGAGLALDYFYPGLRESYDTPLSRLVQYVEDRDLWRFKLPFSKEINAWIQSFDIDLETWFSTVGPQFSIDNARHEGISLLRLENKYIKQICQNAKLKKIREYIAPYVQTSILMSEVCDYLIKNYPGNYPFAFYSFDRKDGKTQYGLRSRSNFDVSVIAKSFGGGGHKQAAGFELDKPLE
jgi:uncharacterized protein